ncbi:MAG TPA: sigma-70 family RNA polymerase sigma factor [Saprospiraceae bacterium]|nr:sigma-70 family RNA polymerase sigma factor [Saprospiraceae bacterium]
MPSPLKEDNANQEWKRELYLKYVEKVHTLCRRFSDCDERAKDFTQECFMEVFKNFHRYDDTKGELGGWIYIVSRNHVLKMIKKEKKLGLRFSDDLSYIPEEKEEELPDLPDQETLIRAIQSLPDGYRNVINLYVFENRSHEEVAEILEISSSTSRSQYARAKKLLKKKLQLEIYVKKEL